MRVAIVHDWLYTLGGAEKVLAGMLRCFPDADVHCLFDVLSDADRAKIGFTSSTRSFMQRMPMIARRHRAYLPLMPLAIEQLDMTRYDLVISSSYAVAKGVLTGPDQLHVAYVHSPIRYAWDLQHQYLRESNLASGFKSWLARALLHRIRIWDARTAHGVDTYLANSHFIARRIRKAYGRSARVIYPPVGVPEILPARTKEAFFLTASRLVPYKNTRVIIEAFRELPDQRLVVAGAGPELERLKAMAGANVTFAGFLPDAELRRMMGVARAFVFAAEEDFGIVPIEAQGEGTPVIALGRGGVRETAITEGPGPTGIFFDQPDPALIAAAVRRFIDSEGHFTPENCHRNALRFAEPRFDEEFASFVRKRYQEHVAQMNGNLARPLPEVEPRGIQRESSLHVLRR